MTFFKKSNEKEVDSEKYIMACSIGEVIPIEKISNTVFSSKILGEGFGIIPTDGNVCSPVKGVVKSIMANNGLAVVIKNADGLLILVHIGIDAEKLKNTVVCSNIEVGDEIDVGQIICKIKLKNSSQGGTIPTITVVITNSDLLTSLKIKTGVIKQLSSPIISYKI